MLKCELCDKRFKTNGNLKLHKAHVHNINVKWYPCDLCDKKFKINSDLKRHKANIHDIDVVWYYCDLCDKKFKTNGNLKQHKSQVHDIAVVWYQCDICDKKFKTNGNRKIHKAYIHNIDVKWYYCDLCDEKFKSNSDLKQHKAQVHNIDVKWYPCDMCDKKFKSNSHLKSHKAHVHNIDVKWYPCDMCDKRFKRNSHLKIHKNKVHDTGDNECTFCLNKVYRIQIYSDTQGDHSICRSCYFKTTGKNSRPEYIASSYLNEHFGTEYLLGSDSRIYGNKCQLYRPDKIYASDTLVLHIEVDEYEHNGRYDYSCDEKRISDIYDEFSGKDYVIIRWNPHRYTPHICGDNGDHHLDDRLKNLVDVMRYITTVPLKNKITVIYMYYSIDNSVIVKNMNFIHL